MLSFVVVVILAMVPLSLQQCLSAPNCNLGVALQVSGNSINDNVLSNVVLALSRSSFIDRDCKGTVGVVMYKSSGIQPADQCAPFPQIPVPDQIRCISRVIDGQPKTTQTGNHLHNGLNHMLSPATGNTWFAGDISSCRTTVGILCDRTIVDPNAARLAAAQLQAKGVRIHCHLIGNTANPYDPAYDDICFRLVQPSDYNNLWLGVENMYQEYDCCGIPTVPATTTTATTTTTPPTTTTTTPTTTTTTTAPTTTTTRTTRPPQPPTPCDSCKIINGVGYAINPSSCSCFFQCRFKVDGTIDEVPNCCECGQFWNQSVIQCLPASDQRCSVDRCINNNVGSYAYEGNCRMYWTCAGGRTDTSLCCDPGFRYNGITGNCEPDSNCRDECNCLERTTLAPAQCRFLANPVDASTFFVREFQGQAGTLQNCAEGTNFNQTTCRCDVLVPVPRPECGPDFDLRCTESPLRDHANNVKILNFDVQVNPSTPGICRFNGNNARLIVNRYSRMDFQRNFAMEIDFNDDGSNNVQNTPIVANSDCTEPPSIEIRIVDNNMLEGYVKTRVGTYTLRVPFRPNQSNKVRLSYNGSMITMSALYQDGTSERNSVRATGDVEVCRCSLQFGFGWQRRYYRGLIDRAQIWVFCVPNNFHP